MTAHWRYRVARPWLHVQRFLNAWIPSPPGAFRILNFHHIPRAHDEALRRLLAYLVDNHGILTPAEVEARLMGRGQGSDEGKIPCLLTFDDGYASQARVATEILDPLGVRGMFFLCPGLMAAPVQQHPEVISRCITEAEVAPADLPPDLAFMSWEEAAGLAAAGHTLGSHTWSHRRLTDLVNGERFQELLEAKQAVAARLNLEVTWFSYPFGDIASIDAPSLAAVAREYRFCASGLRGLNAPGTQPLGLLREEIKLDAPFAYQKLVLAGGLDFFYRRRQQRLLQMLAASGAAARRN